MSKKKQKIIILKTTSGITNYCFNELFVNLGWDYGEIQITIPEDESTSFHFSAYLDENEKYYATSTFDIIPEELEINIENINVFVKYTNDRFDKDDFMTFWGEDSPQNEDIEYKILDFEECLENNREWIRNIIIEHLKTRGTKLQKAIWKHWRH
jgi:hypothetical protein